MSRRSLKTCQGCGRDVWTWRTRGVYCSHCITDESEEERREAERWAAENRVRRDSIEVQKDPGIERVEREN